MKIVLSIQRIRKAKTRENRNRQRPREAEKSPRPRRMSGLFLNENSTVYSKN
jgi:hypothetical protein